MMTPGHLGDYYHFSYSVGGRAGSWRRKVWTPQSPAAMWQNRNLNPLCVCRARAVGPHLAQALPPLLLRFQLLEKLLDCERFVEFCHQKLLIKSKVFPQKITCWRWWERKELEGLFPVPNLEKELLKQIYVHSPAIRIWEKRRFCSLLPPQNLEQGLAR